MATEEFTRTLTVTSDVERAWAVLTDAQQIVSWVDIIHSVEEIEHLKSYTAVLEDRVGPFRLRADLSIDATIAAEGRVIEIEAAGQDRSVGSQLRIEARLELTEAAQGSSITVSGEYSVTGRVASMGSGIVRTKGDLAIDQFISNAGQALGTAS